MRHFLKLVFALAVVGGTKAGFAEQLIVPGLSPEPAPEKTVPACDLIEGSPENCVRTLACIGPDGLWFDGQARGWNSGTLIGTRSDGVPCTGQWAYGGVLGSASAQLQCSDGLKARVIYFAQDSQTGTGIARGMDGTGRVVRAWTGANVLQFLGETDDAPAQLPCGLTGIPIS